MGKRLATIPMEKLCQENICPKLHESVNETWSILDEAKKIYTC
jgi:hypothetical protein